MKARWCISAIIFILTLFGVVNQQQINIPNQEIVLQFTDVELASDAAQNTIARIKNQLQIIGVDNLRIQESENGTLKITYYSDVDVIHIEETLSKQNDITRDYDLNGDRKASKSSSKDIEISYNLDVYEIQKTNNVHLDVDGKFILEPKLKNDRSFNPNFDVSFHDLYIKDRCELIKVAYKVSRSVSIEISEPLHTIPEVRAGPIC